MRNRCNVVTTKIQISDRAVRASLILSVVLALLLGVPYSTYSQEPKNSTLPDGATGAGTAQMDLASKSVLVLHAFERTMPINEATDRGLRTTLDSGGIGSKNQFFEYLDLASNPGPEYRKRLAELMRLRYSQRKIDVVITLYAEALQFLLNEGRDIFPDVPVLNLYMSPGIDLPKTDRRIIDQQVSYDMVGTLELALTLVPRAKRVYVVSGVANTDKRMQNQTQRDFKKWESRLEFQYLSNMSLEQTLTTVSSVPPESIILFVAFILDSTGKSYTSRDVVGRISRVSRAPVFGLYDTLLGHGIAGGSLASYERNGVEAGELALKILRGNHGHENIPAIQKVPPVPMFDWRQLRRWNLSVDALPKGSIIVNREVTLWDFKYYIVGALVFILAEAALIIVLIAQRRRRKKAELSLSQKTEELNQFFSVSLDLLCVANTEGYFVRLNPAFETILGYTTEELMAKPFLAFVHPDDREATTRAMAVLGSQNIVHHFTNRYSCKDGTYRWFEWKAVPSGNLIYGAARDITDRQTLEAQLRRAQKMEALGTFTGGIAHDFNNILAAMMGFAELAGARLPPESPGVSHIQRVMDAGIKGRALIKQLLAFSRPSEQEKEPLLLSNTVRETATLLRASIPATVSIRFDIRSESGGLILGDPVQIQQVLLNLCSNAAHAMKEQGGVLDLELADFSISASEATPDGMKPGLYMRLAVRDTGVGMPPEVIDKIFDPFFTTKRPDEGTGLGLWVVYGIIKAHEGYITVESQPGKGSTFTVYLPKVTQRPKTEPFGDKHVPTGHERVLLVDDEQALTEAGQMLLEDLGYAVTASTSSVEAFALFKADPSRFDLIVTDQTMPDMTGLELAEACLALRPDIPIVLATGFGHAPDNAAARKTGIRAFVMKPLTKGELARVVRNALEPKPC